MKTFLTFAARRVCRADFPAEDRDAGPALRFVFDLERCVGEAWLFRLWRMGMLTHVDGRKLSLSLVDIPCEGWVVEMEER
jgi:hypothetical protein